MIEEIKSFSLAKHEGPYETWPSKTDLFFDGKPTGKKIDGYVLEKQFIIDDYYLIITSYDCPFEETIYFFLLNTELKVISKKYIVRYFMINAIPIFNKAIFVKFSDDLSAVLTIKPRFILLPSPIIKIYFL